MAIFNSYVKFSEGNVIGSQATNVGIDHPELGYNR
jgi:hypothetical protein